MRNQTHVMHPHGQVPPIGQNSTTDAAGKKHTKLVGSVTDAKPITP